MKLKTLLGNLEFSIKPGIIDKEYFDPEDISKKFFHLYIKQDIDFVVGNTGIHSAGDESGDIVLNSTLGEFTWVPAH